MLLGHPIDLKAKAGGEKSLSEKRESPEDAEGARPARPARSGESWIAVRRAI
jgi:hypothetical protein